ncbi:MAG: WD40/YVTN/BNR-like repeat-containing protein, partial [Ktedonobacteraceae bacterium]
FRTTDGGKTWVNVATALFSDATPAGRLPYGGQKSGMHFLNALTGWVTGSVTLPNLAWLYVTHDGGSTWHQQSLLMPPGMPSAHLSILSPTFLSAADGILPVIFSNATTDSDIATSIYTTHDGGQTWQSTVPVSAAVRVLGFADMQHWWATDGTILYSTGDGGNHWTKLSPGGSFKNIVQLDFISDTVGWAISSTAPASSTLLKTVDGGRTWTTISSTVS